ncbi:MAG: hypothetical protein MIN69_26415 [Methylorubrum extorquens]|jgi:hypothetical protein|uniref:Uncharacterized protein n=1 Tax=Methylorubrum extorquens (strain DSM 6343 / CIP 106787 / DM4) TaxID=661410 RepID=C7CA40_METED|nr:hypothetical protein [Methylorubrum extorquens]MBA9067092.1 hypothetical protein [Methylobacterium sp. RAS18]GEL39779.1 hypothetical protein MEX01_03700 [Methylorubrum extorquens]CAX27401.1 conserved protein of unknown function; putative exported protein [Methylorubrum extorquens DM4]
MRRTVAALFVLATAALPAIAGSEPAPALKHVEKTFLIPAEDGYGVGECLSGGPSECGQVVANAWCESQGFASAANYGVAAQDEYTGAIGDAAPVKSAPRPLRITCQD